jgi:uncharacterized membrane protein
MKNNKGQVEIGIGMIMTVFIAVLVGIIFVQSIAQSVGESTNTVELANVSIDTVVNGTVQYLDYRALSDVVIYNETEDAIVGATNYTITNNVINPTTGELSVSITPNAPAAYKSAWQVSATAQPVTYIADGGSRAMAALIVIMFALAIAVVALTPTLQSKLLDAIGK